MAFYVTESKEKAIEVKTSYIKYDKDLKKEIPTERTFYIPSDFKERLKKGEKVQTMLKPMTFTHDDEEVAIVWENEEK